MSLITYRNANRSQILPTVDPKLVWLIVDHLFDVHAEAIGAVDPSDRDIFNQNGHHNRVNGRVVVQELDDIVASLCAAGYAHKHVKGEENAHENLAPLSQYGILVSQSCDDRLAAFKF
jgi:hypothetical protein